MGKENLNAAHALREGTRAAHNIPVLDGDIFGQTVSVLRDTGSNTLVVRRSLVPDSALTGAKVTLLADGSIVEVLEAEVPICSPYFTGFAHVKCLEAPLYDVIVGNVPGARDATDPDFDWKGKSGSVVVRVNSQSKGARTSDSLTV